MQLKDLVDTPSKIGCYGSAGSGKSAFWATLGECCEFIETDPNGYTTLKYLKDKWTEERQKVDISYFAETDFKAPRAFSQVKNRVIEINNQLVQKTYKKKVVVFDTLTSLSEMALHAVKAAKGVFRTSTEIQEWGMAMGEVEQVILMARAWPIPVIFIGHREVKEVDDKSQVTLSVIGQKLLPKVLNYMEEVYYATVVPIGEGKFGYRLQTMRTASIEVKSRRNLPDMWDMSQGAKALFRAINQPLD